ncbi:MAG TPA: glycoside hydrolase family 9 protein, partial [Flavitalea sp.]|nr:glycoside hydrolase family 9 protein [Flavitalea sp.]
MKVQLFLFCICISFYHAECQRFSRDYEINLLTNQVGYPPSSDKTCLLFTSSNTPFEVIDVTSGKTAFTGTMLAAKGDFGTYAIGDFSKLITEGHYYIRADTIRSFPFSISKDVYQPQMNDVVNYFSKQRCGASTTGYLTPCHTDDGLRYDNGKHQDVTGGWHDASDLRKWVSATIYGVIGLARAYNLQRQKYKKRILDEIKWGNQYFLKMQEPAGYVMDFVGGDLEKHSDNNRWTDNKTGTNGTAIKLIKPNAGASQSLMLTSKEHDDRIIQTQAVEMSAQYNFITSQAMVAHITAEADPV